MPEHGTDSAVKDRFWPPREARACLFDFGGTLDANGLTWQDRFFALYEKNGILVDREVFRQAFHKADDALTESGELAEAGLMETIRTQTRRVWSGLGLNGGRPELSAIVTDFFSAMDRHVKRNRSLLLLLRRRYRLGIVSNFYGNLERVCEDLGIRDLFDCLIDSFRVGAVKPDPRIFRAALDRMCIGPAEAIFVGDNPWRDMEGAKGLGMPHVWLAGTNPEQRSPCCPGDPVIPSLEALGPLLLDLGADLSRRKTG
jgi:putative hydrolase of the HAD superfamily